MSHSATPEVTGRVDYNTRDNFGRTALYDTGMQGHHKIVELLQELSAVSALVVKPNL